MDSFGGAAAFSFDAAANEAFVADGYSQSSRGGRRHDDGRDQALSGARTATSPTTPTRPVPPGGTAAHSSSAAPVHCAELSKDGMVYVCDRSNDRIQVFKKDGSFVKEKVIAPKTLGEGSVWDIAFSRDPQQKYIYVADGRT